MSDLDERLRAAKDNAVLQARIWAAEARGQRATVLNILRYFGLPEHDWEALRLIRQRIDAVAAEWDECHYDAPGGEIEIGPAIRRALVMDAYAVESPRAALAVQVEPQPVAWIRFCSDGTYEGPIMDAAMEDVRKRSGAWTPLVPQEPKPDSVHLTEHAGCAATVPAHDPLRQAAEQFLASCKDGNVPELVDYYEDIFREALDGTAGVPVPHPFKEWTGSGPVRPYCANCGRPRNDPLHASGVPGLHTCGHMKGTCPQCHQCLRDQGVTSCPTCEPASGVAPSPTQSHDKSICGGPMYCEKCQDERTAGVDTSRGGEHG